MTGSDALEYHVATLQGIGARARREDSYIIENAGDAGKITEEGLLFALFDGMGGMEDGKLAGETSAAGIQDQFRSMNRGGDLAEQLKTAIFTASRAVEKAIQGKGGSTAVVCIIYREQLYFASVGDSYLYLKRGEELNRLNTEHNICHEEYLKSIRNGRFDPEVCRRAEDAEGLTCFLGMPGMDKMDHNLRPLKLKAGDVILVCSDGVGGVLNEEEVGRSLSFKSEKAMCQQIRQELNVHAKADQDNYTALIIKCAEGVKDAKDTISTQTQEG